jgi:hypothetical protein
VFLGSHNFVVRADLPVLLTASTRSPRSLYPQQIFGVHVSHRFQPRDLSAHCGTLSIGRSEPRFLGFLLLTGVFRVRNDLRHWSRVSMQNDPHSREHYYLLPSKGHSHGRALRGSWLIASSQYSSQCSNLRRSMCSSSTRANWVASSIWVEPDIAD